MRARSDPDPFDPFVDYVTARLAEDPHLWAHSLFGELQELGFGLSYQSLTRNIRVRNLRPVCEACRSVTQRPNAVIPHARGMKPNGTGWNCPIRLNRGGGARRRICWSARWPVRASGGPRWRRPRIPHLVACLDHVVRGLGGVTRVWRFDRMATVCDPGSGRVTASFAGVAKHYGVAVAICPARRGNRKGVVEKVNRTAVQRWWRTLADEARGAAQASLDRFARLRGDTRVRATADGRSSVAVVAKTEPLTPVPALPYPVIVAATRMASRQALVSYRGNRYSVPPELAAAQVVVSHPVGGQFVDITTTGGIVIARHRMAADGLGAMVRDSGHVIALDTAAMATAATGRPHRRTERIPPGPAAKAAAAQLPQLTQKPTTGIESSTPTTSSTVIDLSAYERAAQNRTIQPPPAAPGRPPPQPPPRSHRRQPRATISSCAPIWPSSNWPRPPKLLPRSSTRPATRASRSPSLWSGYWPSKSRPAPPAGWRAGCGSPACPPRRPWPISTSTPPPVSTASSLTSWAPAATSNPRPTSCSSGRQAPAKPTSASDWRGPPRMPATAGTSPCS